MAQLLTLINHFNMRYTLAQRVVLGLVVAFFLSVVLSLLIWSSRPEYIPLYSGLEPTNANQMVAELQGLKIPYEIEDNGETILVPKEEAAELRLRFVEAGLVGQPVSGYELFDDQKLGMTNFMQQLNMRRALEGELAKTINQFQGVKNSRVHLVLPETKLFQNDGAASASVVLNLISRGMMDKNHIKGIAALVANSVEGLEVDDVVVVDMAGNVLSDGQGDEVILGGSGGQWELNQTLENRLENKVRAIVESIVGPQNCMVEVSLKMNFEKVERTIEAYDPENVVVISEERHSESSTNRDSLANSQVTHQNENVVTNYELNKTVEHFVGNSSVIESQSVAVLVNGKYVVSVNDKGEEVREYVNRSNKELAQIESLVKSAVGFTGDRGDIVEVQNMQFDKSTLEEDRQYFEELESRNMMASLINKGLIILAIIPIFLIIRKLFKSSFDSVELPAVALAAGAVPQMAAPGVPGQAPAVAAPEIDEDMYVAKLSPEAQARLKAKDKMTEEVVQYSKDSPENTAKLIRTWMTAPEMTTNS